MQNKGSSEVIVILLVNRSVLGLMPSNDKS